MMMYRVIHGWLTRRAHIAFVIASVLGLLGVVGSINAQEKAKSSGKDQKQDGGKAASKAEQKPAPNGVLSMPLTDHAELAKLKQQIAALQSEVVSLKAKVTTLELEKLGAMVTIDKAKDGKETATVNILKKWAGEKESLELLRQIPNLQVVYIDSGHVNDAAVVALKALSGLTALTLMSPQITDTSLENLKGLNNLTMLFLTNCKVSDKGLVSLRGLKNLQVLALSRTDVTDAGLAALKELKSLKSVYVIGTKVTPQAIEKFKKDLPGVAVYR
jgi:Leucine-rich repeat (LRR) protein